MSTHNIERDLWAVAGMTIAAASAAVASFSGLRGLATAAGWPEHLAWLLPVTVDAYAMTSTRLWLAGALGTGAPAGSPRRTRSARSPAVWPATPCSTR